MSLSEFTRTSSDKTANPASRSHRLWDRAGRLLGNSFTPVTLPGRPPIVQYGLSLALVAFALALAFLMNQQGHGRALYVFIPAVAAAARLGGVGPGLVAVIATALVVDFFMIPPIYDFGPAPEYLPRFILFLACALMGGLISVPRLQSRPSPSMAAHHVQTAVAAAAPGRDALKSRKILIMGMAGGGKTTLANALVRRLNAVHFNGDEVRANIDKELGFSHQDRLEHARRMGWLCDRVVAGGGYAVADFICPTQDTRDAFGDAFIVWVDRIKTGRFADTNAMFQPPSRHDVRVTDVGTAEEWADRICEVLPQMAAEPRAVLN